MPEATTKKTIRLYHGNALVGMATLPADTPAGEWFVYKGQTWRLVGTHAADRMGGYAMLGVTLFATPEADDE